MGDEHDSGPCLPKFDCFGPSATMGPRWTRWLTAFQLFADGKGLIIAEDTAPKVKQRRRALLLHHAGLDVQDIFSTLPDTGGPADYEAAVKALNTYFVPKVNHAYARHQFRQMMPNKGETTRQFATRLRHAIKDCGYGAESDDQIRDELLAKCPSDYLRRRLLEEGLGLTLSRTLELAEQCEGIESQMAGLSVTAGGATAATTTKETVNRVSEGARPKKWKKSGQRGRQGKSKTGRECYRCGRLGHFGRDPDCPARGKTCAKCQGADHFADMCKTSSRSKDQDAKKPTGKDKPRLYAVETNGSGYAFAVNSQNSPTLDIMVGNRPLSMLIDSGASSNVVSAATWEKLKKEGVECSSRASSNKKLFTYASNEPLPVKGTFTCDVRCGRRQTRADFVVIEGEGVPLLGQNTATELGVLKIGADVAAVRDAGQKVFDQYPELFKGVGKLNTHQVTLHIDKEIRPVAQPLRRTPFNLRGKVEQKIRELVEADIIEEVDGPTHWLNPVVVAPKPNGEIRLCLDMRRANEAVIRGRHPIPTVDEVLQSINGSKVFSKLDLKWGYHQLELAPESRDITTFAVHNGIYRYKRLFFGVSSASEQYQYEIAKVIAGIEGVENISDDIIVHGPNQETHDRRLHATLQRLRDRGLTLNKAKCQVNMDRLIFMGMLLSEKGIGPTEERVRALVEARAPQNVHELRSFMGLANYSARFIPGFATIVEPLYQLLKRDVPYDFGPEQQTAFNQLKQEMANAHTLAYFRRNAPTKVIADASPVGLGAVLVQEQDGKEVVVCYASKSLSNCEKRYSQTEKEALGLVWACEKFHPYIYGCRFSLITDHKPLAVIYGPRSKPSARIERWVLRLQPYDFEVVHIKGRENTADSLSRLVPAKQNLEQAEADDDHVRFVAITATPSALSTREIEQASAADDELKEVREAINTGRFDKCKPYTAVAGELCIIGQLVLRGTRIVVPHKLRPQVLALAHEGHLGVVGTKTNLRSKVWWPGIDRAAEKHCRSCHGCQLVARPDPPEPLRPTTLPDGPWQDIAVDLMGPLPSGHSLLVVVDYYSRFYEVSVMQSTATEKVLDCLEESFSRHGLPLSIKSDNGPQFISQEFADYCAANDIRHCRVTARWAQANGEVERQNASLLKRLRIAQAENKDWKQEMRRYLLQYRALPHPATGRSPAELLYNRTIRTKMPGTMDCSTLLDQEIRDHDAEYKAVSKFYADRRRGAQLSGVAVGDEVLVRQDKQNKMSTPFGATPHIVRAKAGSSLVVESPDGTTYSRNTTQVRKYLEPDPKPGEPPELIETGPATDAASGSVPETIQGTGTVIRRSTRARKKPSKYEDFV